MEDEENMRYIDLSAITLINSKNEDDFVCIHYILQNAYDEECNELDYQHQLDEMYKSTNEEMEWNEPMGCYVPKYNYYD